MTWKIELEGHTDNPDQELYVLSVIRNLVEDLKGSASSVLGSFSGDHHDGETWDVPGAGVPPPHFGGPDVERDPETGLPVDSEEYRQLQAGPAEIAAPEES